MSPNAGRASPLRRRETAKSRVVAELLAVVVLWNFAVAQPLLDLLGRNPAFFVAHGSRPVDLVVLAVGLTVVLPALLAALVLGVGRASRRAGVVVHVVVLGLLTALLGWQLLERVGDPPVPVWLPLLGAFGAAGVWAFRRFEAARSLVRWLAPAPLLFLVFFLVLSPAGRIVFPQAAASRSVPVGNPVPVVMVVFDELPEVSLMGPDGRIDGSTFPNFARLAAMSTWYRNTTAVADHTTWAVPAILDGRRPVRSRQPVLADHPANLFTLLAGAYRVDAIEAVTALCPPSECGEPSAGASFGSRMRDLVADTRVVAGHVLLPPPLGESLPPMDQGWAGFGKAGSAAEAVPVDDLRRRAASTDPGAAAARRAMASKDPTGAVGSFIAGFRAPRGEPARPGLHFLHVETPHAPWVYLPDGRKYPLPEPYRYPELDGLGWRNQEFADQGRARHLLQTAYADRLLGVILDELADTGLLDRALVVVTADHGAAFTYGHDRRIVDRATIGDLAWVPLLVKQPGRTTGAVDDRPAASTDILPTVLSTLGARVPRGVGRPLTGPPDGSRRRTILRETGEVLPLPSTAGPRDEALAAALATFPTAPPDPYRLFRRGPYGSLVGTPAPRPLPDADGRLRARIEQVSRFRDVDVRRGPLPVLVYGEVDGPAVARGGRPDVVVSLNGVVAGAGYTFDVEGDRARFTALLDPAAFRRGRNAVEVFTLTGPAATPSWTRARLDR